MSNQRGMEMYAAGILMLFTASLAFLSGCSPVDVSGHIRNRQIIMQSSADRPARSEVVGFGYDRRDWDMTEPIPAGKGRVVLLQPGSPTDQGAGFIFKINDRGDFILGTGNALAWNHPAGTCKIQFGSYLTLGMGGGERRLPGNAQPVFLKISEGKTHWLLFALSRAMVPALSSIEEKDAEKILVNQKLKKSALPTNIEDAIPWLP